MAKVQMVIGIKKNLHAIALGVKQEKELYRYILVTSGVHLHHLTLKNEHKTSKRICLAT